MWSKQVSIIWRLVKRETRVLKGDHVSQANVAIRAGCRWHHRSVRACARGHHRLAERAYQENLSPSVLHPSLDLSKFSPNHKLSIYINEGLNEEYFYR